MATGGYPFRRRTASCLNYIGVEWQRGPPYPSPVFERIYKAYLTMKEQFKGEITDETNWKAIVHIDHGRGFVSRLIYTGKIHEDNGQIYMPYDIANDNTHEDSDTARPEHNTTASGNSHGDRFDLDGGIVIKEVIQWENNKLWGDIACSNSDMAASA